MLGRPIGFDVREDGDGKIVALKIITNHDPSMAYGCNCPASTFWETTTMPGLSIVAAAGTNTLLSGYENNWIETIYS